MKNLLLLFVLIFLGGHHAFSQNVYYGYPSNSTMPKKGDVIILNIPEYTDCRFNKIEDFDNLVKLLKIYKNNNLRIEINFFYGDSLSNKSLSELLCDNFKKVLISMTKMHNYQIVNNSDRNPIFSRREDICYRMYNTRIDIIIE